MQKHKIHSIMFVFEVKMKGFLVMKGVIIHIDDFIYVKKTESILPEFERYLPELIEKILVEKLELIILTSLKKEKRKNLKEFFSSYLAYIHSYDEIPLQTAHDYLFITDNQALAKNADFKQGVICYYQYSGNDEFNGYLQGVVLQGLEEVDVPYLKEIYHMYKGSKKIVMRSERLTVRESESEDEELFIRWQSDTTEEVITDLEEYCEHHYRYYGFGLWTIVRSSDEEVIGRAGIEYRILADQPVLELGYIIGPSYRGQGYAYEACLRILQYAWEELSATEVCARVRSDNEPSVCLLNKIGFSYKRKLYNQIQLFTIIRGEA